MGYEYVVGLGGYIYIFIFCKQVEYISIFINFVLDSGYILWWFNGGVI